MGSRVVICPGSHLNMLKKVSREQERSVEGPLLVIIIQTSGGGSRDQGGSRGSSKRWLDLRQDLRIDG